MGMQLRQRTYIRVPRNSVVHATVTPKTGTGYHLNGRIDKGDTRKKSWSHSALKNKTITYKLSDSGTHYLRISCHFTGSSNSAVEIELKIMKPNGAQHSTHWTARLNGKNGDLSRAKVTIRVRS